MPKVNDWMLAVEDEAIASVEVSEEEFELLLMLEMDRALLEGDMGYYSDLHKDLYGVRP